MIKKKMYDLPLLGAMAGEKGGVVE